MISLSILFFIFWLTSTDRSINGMVKTITADFESKVPSVLEMEHFYDGR